MQLLKTKTLLPEQETQLDRLWNAEYPVKLANRFSILLTDVEDYLHYLLLDAQKQITGWLVAFRKEDEIRFSILVPAAFQGQGHGRRLLDALKADTPEFYGWVIDHNRDVKATGEPYQTPMPFYLNNGFEVLSEQRIDTEMISAVKIRWSNSSGAGLLLSGKRQETPILIETPRLHIRELLPEDETALFAMDSDPEVHRYLGNEPYTQLAQSRENIAIIRQQYADHGIGRWAVILKETGMLIGWTGFKRMTEPVNGHCDHLDFGYRFARAYWGQGYAHEASQAALAYGIQKLGFSDIYGMTAIDNTRSRRLLEKVGFQLISIFAYDAPPITKPYYGLPTTWYQFPQNR